MKIKVELELDTDNQKDLDKIEEIVVYLQQVKDLLDTKNQNLNKNVRRRSE